MKLQEKEFKQGFDIIITRTRPTLDIEKDKYPGDEVTFYLNGSTGEFSSNRDDVVRSDFAPRQVEFSAYSSLNKTYLSAQYDEDQELVFFYMVKADSLPIMRHGQKIGIHEFGRFAVDKKRGVYTKEQGLKKTSRGYVYIDEEREIRKFKEIPKDGEYTRAFGKEELPLTPQNYAKLFSCFLNMETGEEKGFLQVVSNIFPEAFCTSGNLYRTMTSYPALYEYFEVMDKEVSCIKKAGKKQDYIDKMLKFELPEVKQPNLERYNAKQLKFAAIQKVEGAEEPTCCIRTMIYDRDEEKSFANGRIYISKKTAEFCKINNYGEWVAQPLLQKPEHWDFEVQDFDAENTKGTMLEYFGSILKEIDNDNKALAILTFIKYPFMESVAKIMPDGFVNNIIDAIRESGNTTEVFHSLLGVADSSNKKALKALGVNNVQLEKMKDVLLDGTKGHYLFDDKKYVLQKGMLPFLKFFMCGSSYGDISDYDIETFKRYLDFASDIYSTYTIFEKQEDAVTKMIIEITNLLRRVTQRFPNFNKEKLFPIFTDLVFCAGQYGYDTDYSYQYTAGVNLRYFNDYLSMLNGIEHPELYKPEFSSFEDLQTMHDNISILKEANLSAWAKASFDERYEDVWNNWEFSQEEKKNKDGIITQESLPFIVVAPRKPIELAKEGTMLHHCVKHYIDRVAEGKTNIVFIRKAEEPDKPFFTVEISNDKKIEQVHGFSNRNANTEPGLEDFVNIWAKKKHLKTNNINKVR